MKFKQFTMATLATLLITSGLVAQQAQPSKTQNPPAQAKQDQPATGQSARESVAGKQQGEGMLTKDQIFAKCMEIANQEQVLIAQFAQGKATHTDVKEFAATLEKAHKSGWEQLKALSPQDETNSTFRTVSTTRASNSPVVDFLQLHQEFSTQCLTDSKKYLSEKQGIEFDQCFVAMQIAKHAGERSNLTVLQRHATGKLQELIKSNLETNAQHMEAAVGLMKKLADSDSSKTNQ
jgi:predicted outer membrane protein